MEGGAFIDSAVPEESERLRKAKAQKLWKDAEKKGKASNRQQKQSSIADLFRFNHNPHFPYLVTHFTDAMSISSIGGALSDILFNPKYAGCVWKITVAVDNLGNIVWICPVLPGTSADVKIWDKYGPQRTKGCFMEFEVGAHDGAYKGRLHSHVPFIGRKTLTMRQKTYNDVHGYYRARVEHLFAHLWSWRVVRDIWLGSHQNLHANTRILCTFHSSCCEGGKGINLMAHGSTFLLPFGQRKRPLRLMRKRRILSVAKFVAKGTHRNAPRVTFTCVEVAWMSILAILMFPSSP